MLALYQEGRDAYDSFHVAIAQEGTLHERNVFFTFAFFLIEDQKYEDELITRTYINMDYKTALENFIMSLVETERIFCAKEFLKPEYYVMLESKMIKTLDYLYCKFDKKETNTDEETTAWIILANYIDIYKFVK
jgi:hypothetical protein